MEQIDVAIIGAGVVGAALARELSTSIEDLFLLEQMPKAGMMTSTRNSGVIHSGIYYAPGSLKARFCLPGNQLTKELCAKYGVPIKHCGKLIVALEESETPQLGRLEERGRTNGVEGLRIIGKERIRELEPNIHAVAALEVPSTAVVNAEELVKTYARLACDQGASLLTEARVVSLEPRQGSIEVTIERGSGPGNAKPARESFEARCVVNSAGLYADEIAALIEGPKKYRIYPVRGEYARMQRSKANLVNALVYPLPHSDVYVRDVTSRKVHLTRTVDGDLLIGPTARYVSSKDDYEHDLLPVEDFVRDTRPFLPGIEAGDLRPAHSGLRPQLIPPGQHGTADYIIERHASCDRLINLVGIESPALTSAPAIAQYVASLVKETLS